MDNTQQGIVTATRGRLFDVSCEDGQQLKCEVRQKVKDEIKATTPVAVGDDVLVCQTEEERGIIEQVLPRRTQFARPSTGDDKILQVIAANLDQLAIVVSLKSPALKPGLIDRFIIAALMGNMNPIIVINKADLKAPKNFDEIVKTYKELSYPVFITSAEENIGLDDFSNQLSNHRTLFAGHSGVGKSSLLNKLIPGLDIKTKQISHASNKGQHTTTSIELFEIPSGGYLIDSPGLKVMGLWDIDKQNLTDYYIEFAEFQDICRFSSCSHSHEPDCAIKEAVKKGSISKIRYENYLAIADSLT
jgi:ribosome biogenesis GTPase